MFDKLLSPKVVKRHVTENKSYYTVDVNNDLYDITVLTDGGYDKYKNDFPDIYLRITFSHNKSNNLTNKNKPLTVLSNIFGIYKIWLNDYKKILYKKYKNNIVITNYKMIDIDYIKNNAKIIKILFFSYDNEVDKKRLSIYKKFVDMIISEQKSEITKINSVSKIENNKKLIGYELDIKPIYIFK